MFGNNVLARNTSTRDQQNSATVMLYIGIRHNQLLLETENNSDYKWKTRHSLSPARLQIGEGEES